MKSRLAASVVLSALVLTGATGCTFITPQASTIAYSASDGVNVSDESGPVAVRNVFIVAEHSGERGNLVGAFINDTQNDETVIVQVQGLDPFEIEVEAGETLSLGADAEPLLMDSADGDGGPLFPVGSAVDVHFQSGDGKGATESIFVLDGTLPYYADLEPESRFPEPTPEPIEEEHSESEAH